MGPAAALDALGDPTRREIFERVVARPCRIGFLADQIAVSKRVQWMGCEVGLPAEDTAA